MVPAAIYCVRRVGILAMMIYADNERGKKTKRRGWRMMLHGVTRTVATTLRLTRNYNFPRTTLHRKTDAHHVNVSFL